MDRQWPPSSTQTRSAMVTGVMRLGREGNKSLGGSGVPKAGLAPQAGLKEACPHWQGGMTLADDDVDGDARDDDDDGIEPSNEKLVTHF